MTEHNLYTILAYNRGNAKKCRGIGTTKFLLFPCILFTWTRFLLAIFVTLTNRNGTDVKPCLNSRRKRFIIITVKSSNNGSTFIHPQIQKLILKNGASFISLKRTSKQIYFILCRFFLCLIIIHEICNMCTYFNRLLVVTVT